MAGSANTNIGTGERSQGPTRAASAELGCWAAAADWCRLQPLTWLLFFLSCACAYLSVEEDIDSKRMCALVPSAVFKKGELEVKENAKEKEAEAKHAEAEAKTKEKEKEKVKETKAIKSKAPGAVVEHKHKESGSGVTKQTEETKEPAAAASKAAPKVTTKVASS